MNKYLVLMSFSIRFIIATILLLKIDYILFMFNSINLSNIFL